EKLHGHGEPDESRTLTDRLTDAPDDFAEGHPIRPDDRNGLSRQFPFHDRRAKDSDDVFDGDWGYGRFFSSGQSEDRKGGKRVAQVVEKMVAPSVNDSRLENGVVETTASDDLLGMPLRFMVGETAIGTSGKEAREDHLLYVRAACGADHSLGTLNVHSLVRLGADLAIDSGAMRDDRTSAECLLQRASIANPRLHEGHSGEPHDIPIAPVSTTSNENDLVPLLDESTREVSPNEPCTSGNCDPHR